MSLHPILLPNLDNALFLLVEATITLSYGLS